MSGGSWNYFYCKLEDNADSLKESPDPLRRALGVQMQKMSEAMHAIEWVDSCDWGAGDEIEPIKKCLDFDAASELVVQLQKQLNKLQEDVNEVQGVILEMSTNNGGERE